MIEKSVNATMNWIEAKDKTPKREKRKSDGLPKLYLCQIMTCDMTFGWRFSYRVACINDKGKWNVENPPYTYVTKWMPIDCDESMETMLEYIKEITDNESR